jgi:protein transport protein DSL1/ZW10
VFVQKDIQGLSQESSSEVDEWIKQARRLQEDIQKSKAVAFEIVKEHEEGLHLQAKIQDAKAKLELLHNETAFSKAVTSSLEETWSMDKDLNEAESALSAKKLIELAAKIEQLSFRAGRFPDSNAKVINENRISQLRSAVVEGLTSAATSMVEFQKAGGQQRVKVNPGNHGRYCTWEFRRKTNSWQSR